MIGYRDLIDLALETDPAEKIRLASAAFLRTTVFTGLAVTYRPRDSQEHRFLFTAGYSDDALSHLRSRFIHSDPWYRRAVADATVLTWRDSRFADGEAARQWLTPVGYRNGFSVPVHDAQKGEIGSVHANSHAAEFGDQQLDAATAFADLLAVLIPQKKAQDAARLTVRELHVVRLIAEGVSNPEIAALLGVSRRTVATHVENILRKLGTRSRVGIAVAAIRMGLI